MNSCEPGWSSPLLCATSGFILPLSVTRRYSYVAGQGWDTAGPGNWTSGAAVSFAAHAHCSRGQSQVLQDEGKRGLQACGPC